MKLVRGTFRGDRARQVVVSRLEGEVRQPPPWLTASARHLWAIKVETYARRGQVVAGCEPMLAQFCALGSELVRRYRKGLEVPAAADVPTGFRGAGVKSRAVAGHEYGLDLSEADRAALIAFLRTL